MDVVCAPPADYTPEDSSCLCRPAYHFEGIQLEHGTLGLAQLAKATYLFLWVRVRRRRAVAHEANSLIVLPVYARFLTFEAWSCVVWGLFYLGQSFYEMAGDRLPRAATVVLQLARYGSAFTWALCGEGVFLFLCFSSAGAESLHAGAPSPTPPSEALARARCLQAASLRHAHLAVGGSPPPQPSASERCGRRCSSWRVRCSGCGGRAAPRRRSTRSSR